MERQEGYYWVNCKGKFVVAEYLGNKQWYMCGFWFRLEESYFEHINENRIKAPGEIPD